MARSPMMLSRSRASAGDPQFFQRVKALTASTSSSSFSSGSSSSCRSGKLPSSTNETESRSLTYRSIAELSSHPDRPLAIGRVAGAAPKEHAISAASKSASRRIRLTVSSRATCSSAHVRIAVADATGSASFRSTVELAPLRAPKSLIDPDARPPTVTAANGEKYVSLSSK